MPLEGGGGGAGVVKKPAAKAPAPKKTPAPATSPPPSQSPPAGTDASSSGPNYGGGAKAPVAPPVDWAEVLGAYGLPPDVITALNNIWTTTGAVGDVQQAVLLAQAYVRGTQWYRDTYPGIQDGINAGLFGDEQGYRAYRNQVTQLYDQYFSRAPTDRELTGYITSGKSVGQVANQMQAGALMGTISDPLRALFTQDELRALTDEQAGIDSGLGEQITQQANLAVQVGQMYKDFFGRALTRPELDQLVKSGTDASTVARQFATASNVNAMNPAIAGLFTPSEIHEIALDAAGGTTQYGKELGQLASLAAQLNQVYLTYHGTQVTRDELNQAWNDGLSADQVARHLESGSILAALPAYLGGLFNTQELQAIAAQESGESDTAQGRQLLLLEQNADQYNQAYLTYMGRGVTRDELGQYIAAGTAPGQVGAQLAASQFAGSLPGEVASLFTPEELKQAGLASTGAEGTAQDNRMLALVQNAGSYNAVSRQYTGGNIARTDLERFYDQGISAGDYAKQSAGTAYANANRASIQQTAGSYGEGELSQEQLQALGQEQTGYDTPAGQALTAAFDRAQKRMAGVFRGSLASPAVRAITRAPDVAA